MVAPVAALPKPRDGLDSFRKAVMVGDAAQENPYQKIVLEKKNDAPVLGFSACSRSHDRTSIPGKGAMRRKKKEAPLKPRTGGAGSASKRPRTIWQLPIYPVTSGL